MCKTCKKCGVEKPLSDFYKHSKMADGHLNICKVCKRAYSIKHRYENIDKVREYDKSRATYERSKKGTINHRNKNPEKYKARTAVGNALRDGRLVKMPCEVCGCKDVHGHHDDYNKPLEVRWLCQQHHTEWHKENGFF